MNRKKFIATSASASTALLLSSLNVLSSTTPTNMDKNIKLDLQLLATNWGFQGNLDAYCTKVKAEGYDGVEIWWPTEKKWQDEIFDAMKKYNLSVGFLFG